MKPLVFKKSRRARRTEREPVRHKLHVAKGDRVRVIRGLGALCTRRRFL